MNINIEMIQAYITSMGLKLLAALVLLFIGLKITNLFVSMLAKALKKKEYDPSLTSFLTSVLSWALKICVIITAINTAGVQTTSFVALLGTAGLAVGMALQGSLSNFAGGVLILILKPFKVGDFIKVQGHMGTVYKITTFATVLKTGDNQIITLPNGPVANTPIVNVNQEPTRRVDFTFGIGYGDSISEAKRVLNEIITSDERVLKDPAHAILVSALADSSVNIVVKAWVNTSDYWGVYHDITEKVKLAFDENNISIPFPQTDVHVHQVNS